MLVIPKRPLLPLATKGFAVFSIGFVGSMGVLNYFHPGATSTPTTSSVVAPTSMNVSARTGTAAAANSANTSSGDTAATDNTTTQWQATLPAPSGPRATYAAPATQPTQPTPAATPSVSPSLVVPDPTSVVATPTPAPAPAPSVSDSGSSASPLPQVNLQGVTDISVPLLTTIAPLN